MGNVGGRVEWGDLQYFLEVARCGTLTAAAKRLGVEHSTVARRIDRLESRYRMPLFDRRRDGYVLTEGGLALLPRAEAMESAALAAQEEATGSRAGASGLVKLGTPEVFGTRFITPRIGTLLAEHPDLSVDLLLLPRFPNLANREADLVVTLTPPEAGRYVVSRLVDIHYHLYGAPAYLAAHPPIATRADLGGHRFVDYAQDHLLADDLKFLEEFLGAPRRVLCASGMLAQVEAVQAGIGLGMLTTYAVAAGSPLVRVLPEQIVGKRTLWLVAPADLLKLQRVRVVWDFLRDIVKGFESGA
jgi:DNA-binding transcriptional LysR family regulator